MAKRKPKRVARSSTVKSGLIGATRAIIGRKPKPKKKKSLSKRIPYTMLPRNAAIVKTPLELDNLFNDIRRAQKESGKEIIIIWLR